MQYLITHNYNDNGFVDEEIIEAKNDKDAMIKVLNEQGIIISRIGK